MPLVAVNERGDRIAAPDVPDQVWNEWRGASIRRRERMVCKYCEHEMHPKRLENGTKFFAHNPGSECPFAAASHESPAHLRTKERVYLAVTRTGWAGELEAHGRDDSTGDEYQIDVLATPPDPQRAPWAYEVQMSKQNDAETERRTKARQNGHRARVTWMNVREQSWDTDFPSVQLDEFDQWTVVDGVMRELDEQEAPIPMDQVITRFHNGSYFWIQGFGYVDQRARGLGSRLETEPRRRHPSKKRVADDCDRPERRMPSISLPPPLTASWGDDEWWNFARMAHARKAAAAPLDWKDLEALSRYPVCPTWADSRPSRSH